jgi:hypothetical protein
MAQYPILRLTKGSALTYAEMDSNLTWLSSNLSGSIVNITGSSVNISGPTNIAGNVSSTGIFSGSGANLFNIPASGITGLNLSRIATGSITASVDTNSNASFKVVNGANTIFNITNTGRVWVGQGTAVDAGYQADIFGNTRVTGQFSSIGTSSFSTQPHVYLAPYMSGSNGVYQNLSAVTIAPTFVANSALGAINTALDIPTGNIQLGASLVVGSQSEAGTQVDNYYAPIMLGYEHYNASNILMASRSGSIAIGIDVGGGGSLSQILRNNVGNPRNVAIGHGAGNSNYLADNVIIGYLAGRFGNISNAYNVIVGGYAMGASADGNTNNNVAIGYQASYRLGLVGFRQNSVAIGYQANYSGSGNSVMIGSQAGFSELNPQRLYIANSSTTSPLIGGDFFSGSVGINMIISNISASLHVKGTGATSASNAFIVDNSNLVDLLKIVNNGQQVISSPLMTLSSSNSGYLISQSLTHSGSTAEFSKLVGVNITPTFFSTTSSQTETALRVSPIFTGSYTGSLGSNIIADFGTSTSGSILLIDDITSGSVYTVNDYFGLPVLETTSDAQVNMYDYPYVVFNKSASYLSLGLPATYAIDSAINIKADLVIDEGLGTISRVAQGNGTTVNDSTASLYTYTFGVPSGSVFMSAVVTGYDSTSRDMISGEVKSSIRYRAGTAAVVGTNFRFINADNIAVSFDITASSNTAILRAYGTGSKTYVWGATVTTQIT